MADIQNWTNFSGGCIGPNEGGHSSCAQGFIFTNFIMGMNFVSFGAAPYVIAPSGDVVCTSRNNNANCYGYHTQYLQNDIFQCNSNNHKVLSPVGLIADTTISDSGAPIVNQELTIGTIVNQPIFGLGILTDQLPEVDHVTGFGGIIDTVTNTLNVVQWNNQSLNTMSTILASVAYVIVPGHKLNTSITLGVNSVAIQVYTDTVNTGSITVPMAAGNYSGLLVVGSGSGNISDTVDVSEVNSDIGVACA